MPDDNSDDYRKRLSDLASDERVKEIESQVFLDIPAVEAGAYRTLQFVEDTSAFLEKLISEYFN